MDIDDHKIEIVLTYAQLRKISESIDTKDSGMSKAYDAIVEAMDDYYFEEITKRKLRVYEE